MSMVPTPPTEDELAERGRALVAAAVADTHAPHGLRARVEAGRSQRRAPRRHLAIPAAALGAAAAAVVAVVLLASGGSSGPSSFDRAANLAGSPPAEGLRRDRVAGHDATTIAYGEAAGATIGYTIVEGPPLDAPAGSPVRLAGRTYHVVRGGDRVLVTWEQGGRTCIIAGPRGTSAKRLLDLASRA
jgi:hypothetical protein